MDPLDTKYSFLLHYIMAFQRIGVSFPCQQVTPGLAYWSLCTRTLDRKQHLYGGFVLFPWGTVPHAEAKYSEHWGSYLEPWEQQMTKKWGRSYFHL